MKVLLLFLCATTAFCDSWEAVQRLAQGSRIEVRTNATESIRGTFISGNETAIVMRAASGEQSIMRNSIRRVAVADPSRRIRNGLIATAAGAGIGYAIGVAVCPSCQGEGVPGKFTGPLSAIGAAVGAAGGFIPLSYRTVYKSK